MELSESNQIISEIYNTCPFNLKEQIDKTNSLIKNQEETHYSYSLNENNSANHLTPFHLSFYKEQISSAKKKGSFFTPSYISDFIIEKSLSFLLSKKADILEQIFGDIACGSGNLLLSLLYQLCNILSEDKKKSKQEFIKLILNNIYGFDTDPVSLWITRIRILFFLSQEFPNLSINMFNINLYLADALKTLNIEQKEVNNSFFDLIILNPPYMNYGLRNAQKYDKNFRNFLKKNFFSAEYKLSLYPIFMERSIELLKKDGILGIITPDSFLLGRYYSKIRSYLLQKTNILDISLLGFEPFSGVTLGRPTVSFYRKNNKPSESSFYARWIPSFSSFKEKKWEEYSNHQSKFTANFHNRFHLFFNSEDEKFIVDWNNRSTQRLQDIVTIHTGVRSKITQKNIISSKKEGDTWKKGIISSGQIRPFYLDYQNHWINIDPSLLWSGGYNKEIIEKPKIILRQTGYKIISCVDLNGYFHLNNCHSMSPKNKRTNLFALAAVLNSDEFNRLYHVLSIEKGRALAQIDIEFLLKLPIFSFEKEERKLQEFYWQKNRDVKRRNTLINYSLDEAFQKT